jgi:hypothetical protein
VRQVRQSREQDRRAPELERAAGADKPDWQGMAIRYACDGFEVIDAANIMHAARIFANRVAHQKYGPKGRCRTLRLRIDRGAHGATFEAFVGIPPLRADVGESYQFTVRIVREPNA